jgi:hypothetical protein
MSEPMRRIRRRKEPEKLPGKRMAKIIAAALLSTGTLMSQAVQAAEPAYSVVTPLGKVNVERIRMVPRLDTLSNKTVCLISNSSQVLAEGGYASKDSLKADLGRTA